MRRRLSISSCFLTRSGNDKDKTEDEDPLNANVFKRVCSNSFSKDFSIDSKNSGRDDFEEITVTSAQSKSLVHSFSMPSLSQELTGNTLSLPICGHDSPHPKASLDLSGKKYVDIRKNVQSNRCHRPQQGNQRSNIRRNKSFGETTVMGYISNKDLCADNKASAMKCNPSNSTKDTDDSFRLSFRSEFMTRLPVITIQESEDDESDSLEDLLRKGGTYFFSNINQSNGSTEAVNADILSYTTSLSPI